MGRQVPKQAAKQTVTILKNDSLIKKMPHPAIEFDRDKNDTYLAQDESVETFVHISKRILNPSSENLKDEEGKSKDPSS